MCGITGIKAFNEIGRFFMVNNSTATNALKHRGPDSQGFFLDDLNLLSHRRLSILDTSTAGNQPMRLENDRYVIAYNGEVYNFKSLRQTLQNGGISFKSNTDTEVVLQLIANKGIKSLEELNGFFALAIYDKDKNELTIARDRVGIKPLYYYLDHDKFIFSSEIKSVLEYKVPKEIDNEGLVQYLQYNFIPEPQTIFKGIISLQPGHFMTIKADRTITKQSFVTEKKQPINPKRTLRETIEEAIDKRLISDVELGCFLSGGIDSTIISGVAAQRHPGIHTFSIGYKDNPFFDESSYAELAATKFGTTHHTFMLSEHDLLAHVDDLLRDLDQPFADSSALPTYILAKESRKHVKVALSGDGADELFAGYNKHKGEHLALNPGFRGHLVSALAPLWSRLPQSRNGKLSNTIRQLSRYAEGRKLSFQQRYQQWCKINDEEGAFSLVRGDMFISRNRLTEMESSEVNYLKEGDLNSILINDQKHLLINDMLTKVDRMSMANSLEVRVPFLDKSVIDFANRIPLSQKINSKHQKIILKKSFEDLIPQELLNRPKHGFDVPLLKWLRNELSPRSNELLLDKEFIEHQNIFDFNQLNRLINTLNSSNPKDSHAQVWGLLVFQSWFKQTFQ